MIRTLTIFTEFNPTCLLIFVLLMVSSIGASSQHEHSGLEISAIKPASNDYLLLLQPNEVIKNNNLSNELILDLVDASVTDPVLEKPFERHRIIGGRILRLIGYRWKRINGKKEKFVGTAVKHVRIPEEEVFSDYDINWDLSSRLYKYFQLVHGGKQVQIEIDRKMKKVNTDRPPFTYPQSPAQQSIYRMHCEWTPPKAFRTAIDSHFLPCLTGSNMNDHRNFGEELVSIGLYGAYCSDCNHSCHPEIHPYEWIWWLNFHPDQLQKQNSKNWLIGLVVEGSDRFPNWSPSPRTGTIAIPFIFPVKSERLDIHFEHLVYGTFNNDGFKDLKNVPHSAESMNWNQKTFEFSYQALSNVKINVSANEKLVTDALRIWFDELSFDPKRGLVYGKLYLAASVNQLYTGSVTFSYQ